MLMLLKIMLPVKRENQIKETQSYNYIICIMRKGAVQFFTLILFFWISQESVFLVQEI